METTEASKFHKRAGIALIELLTVISTTAVLIGLLFPVPNVGEAESSREWRTSNLQQLELTLHATVAETLALVGFGTGGEVNGDQSLGSQDSNVMMSPAPEITGWEMAL